MKQTKIQWHQWTTPPADDGGGLGHGVHFHDIKQAPEHDLVGFIDGFEWFHGRSAVVCGYHIKPNSVTTARVLAAMKRRIEVMVAGKQVKDGMISRRIYACANA
jgi:hypothetical protein